MRQKTGEFESCTLIPWGSGTASWVHHLLKVTGRPKPSGALFENFFKQQFSSFILLLCSFSGCIFNKRNTHLYICPQISIVAISYVRWPNASRTEIWAPGTCSRASGARQQCILTHLFYKRGTHQGGTCWGKNFTILSNWWSSNSYKQPHPYLKREEPNLLNKPSLLDWHWRAGHVHKYRHACWLVPGYPAPSHLPSLLNLGSAQGYVLNGLKDEWTKEHHPRNSWNTFMKGRGWNISFSF